MDFWCSVYGRGTGICCLQWVQRGIVSFLLSVFLHTLFLFLFFFFYICVTSVCRNFEPIGHLPCSMPVDVTTILRLFYFHTTIE